MDTIIMALIAIVVLVLLCVIIVRNQKTGVYLYFLLACILPSYFGVELSGSLPLITGTRMLIILMLLYALIHKRQVSFYAVIREQRMLLIFLMYFVFRIVAEVAFFPSLSGYVIKELFSIIFEQFLVVFLIVRIVNNEQMFEKCLKFFAYGAVIILCVGILQSFTGINLAAYLNTVDRSMLQTNALRLGFTRAEASFGHPVYFGEFCVLVMPVFSYLYDNTRRGKYLLFLIIDLVALVLSNSRGAILPGVIILVLMIMKKSRRVKWKYIGAAIIGIVGFIILSTFVPSIGDTVSTIFKSIVNVFGAGYDLGDYGGNSEGLDSRTSQLSGILWVIMNGAVVFGFGPEAHMRGLVSYFINNRWQVLETIDVGYVGFFLCEGVVGTIGQLALIFGLIFNSNKKRDKNDITNMNNSFFYIFLAYAILLLSATGLGITYWTLIGLYIAYNNIYGKSKEK